MVTDCSLTQVDADIFIQLAQLTVIKENETLRLVCMRRKKKKNQEGKQESQCSHHFFDQQASDFLGLVCTEMKFKNILFQYTHTQTYSG